MNFFPSPPSSPVLSDDKVICGSCDKTLSSDWFCSDCHTKCKTCNRFLTKDEYCSRCWIFDDKTHSFVRKNANSNHFYFYYYSQYYYYQQQPSPTIHHKRLLPSLFF